MIDVELMVWLQTIMIGINTVVLLLISGSAIKWVSKNERQN